MGKDTNISAMYKYIQSRGGAKIHLLQTKPEPQANADPS